MVIFFLKNKKCSNSAIFISKKYKQIFFRSENFNYKIPILFELQTVELPISYTNFNNKIPISESFFSRPISVWSLFCAIRGYTSLHFLPILLRNLFFVFLLFLHCVEFDVNLINFIKFA